jgi:hypothetical protein
MTITRRVTERLSQHADYLDRQGRRTLATDLRSVVAWVTHGQHWSHTATYDRLSEKFVCSCGEEWPIHPTAGAGDGR